MIRNSETLTDQSLVGVEGIGYKENEAYPVQDIQPVPMSEAVLEQCNFKFHSYFKFWQLITREGVCAEMDIEPDYNLIDYMRRPVVKKIASLHQLQNIYFTLYGKELDFEVETAVVVNGTLRGGIHTK
ncbi:hypothetical protein HRH25_17460 [Flavisolibacter sp. BT320]|nr:hypothetical protein [Flavisolibacter longurius]